MSAADGSPPGSHDWRHTQPVIAVAAYSTIKLLGMAVLRPDGLPAGEAVADLLLAVLQPGGPLSPWLVIRAVS
jgi:hypothetical protein